MTKVLALTFLMNILFLYLKLICFFASESLIKNDKPLFFAKKVMLKIILLTDQQDDNGIAQSFA